MNYIEVLRQEYSGNNCIFSAGLINGHESDTMYLKFEKDGLEPEIIHLRPDEMACIAWLASGVLWSNEMSRIDANIEIKKLVILAKEAWATLDHGENEYLVSELSQAIDIVETSGNKAQSHLTPRAPDKCGLCPHFRGFSPNGGFGVW